MNSNKEADGDSFQEDSFKHGLHALVPYMVDLFNHVVCIGFPSTWSQQIIHPTHKSGPNLDHKNYSNIMVGHTLSKLYAPSLHLKISKELEQKQLRAKGYAGF